jgi:hypothetical protein
MDLKHQKERNYTWIFFSLNEWLQPQFFGQRIGLVRTPKEKAPLAEIPEENREN